MSVHRPILKKLLTHPRHPYITDDQRTYTGLTLYVAALHVASAIERTTKAKHVGVLLPTSGMFPIAALASWMLGRVVVPLNYLLKPDELQYVIDNSDIDTIITAGPMLDFLEQAPKVENLIKLDELNFKKLPRPRRSANAGDDDLACLLYTSGTSGKPKGVMLTHGNLTAAIKAAAHHASITPDDVFMGVLPQFHCFGLIDLTLLPLTLGSKILYTARFNPAKMLGLAREHKPSVLIIIPAMYNALANSKSGKHGDLDSLRYCVSGGEPLSDAVSSKFKEKFGVTINEGFGMTETSAASNWCLPEMYKPHSVGPTLPGIEARIISQETGEPAPEDGEGELQLRGPTIMKGYYKLPEETAKAIEPDGFLHTGDMARIDSDGHVHITGRIKEMLIVGGENVFPREIEEVIDSHPAVSACGVVGRPDDARGEVPIAFVEPMEGETIDTQEVLNLCREKLSGYKVPKQIRVIDQLPRNPTGKILRRDLKALLESEGENPAKGA
ncbi:MAG: long-chain acyl-CoA synthetase [Phycisphaerales bacterium]|jgi:long-chain acyl-CoA synthetase